MFCSRLHYVTCVYLLKILTNRKSLAVAAYTAICWRNSSSVMRCCGLCKLQGCMGHWALTAGLTSSSGGAWHSAAADPCTSSSSCLREESNFHALALPTGALVCSEMEGLPPGAGWELAALHGQRCESGGRRREIFTPLSQLGSGLIGAAHLKSMHPMVCPAPLPRATDVPSTVTCSPGAAEAAGVSSSARLQLFLGS